MSADQLRYRAFAGRCHFFSTRWERTLGAGKGLGDNFFSTPVAVCWCWSFCFCFIEGKGRLYSPQNGVVYLRSTEEECLFKLKSSRKMDRSAFVFLACGREFLRVYIMFSLFIYLLFIAPNIILFFSVWLLFLFFKSEWWCNFGLVVLQILQRGC